MRHQGIAWLDKLDEGGRLKVEIQTECFYMESSDRNGEILNKSTDNRDWKKEIKFHCVKEYST